MILINRGDERLLVKEKHTAAPLPLGHCLILDYFFSEATGLSSHHASKKSEI